MTTSEGWTWEFRDRAKDAFEGVETDTQQRIVSKLDDIVSDEWRDPNEYVEPLTGAPHGKIRVGNFRLGAHADHETKTWSSIRSSIALARTSPATIDPTWLLLTIRVVTRLG